MHRVLISFLVVTLCLAAAYGQEEEYCDECSKYFDDKAANSLKEKITEISPFHVKGIGHCGTCVFTGVNNFIRIPDKPACVTKASNGDIIRHMFVEFPNVTGQCHCEFSEDPTDNIKRLLESVADPIISVCSIPHIATGLNQIKLFPEKIQADDVQSLEKCIPALADILFQKHPFADFKIGASVQNTRFSFDLVTKAGSSKAIIENSKVLTENAVGWKQMCEGSDLLQEGCRCLLETNYLNHVFLQFVKFILPCGLEKRGQFAIPEILNEMACPV